MITEAFRDRDFPSMRDKRSRAQMRADADAYIPDSLAGEPEVATSLAQAMGSEEPDVSDRLEGGEVEVDIQRMTDEYPKIKAAFQYLLDNMFEGDYVLQAHIDLKKLLSNGELYLSSDMGSRSRGFKVRNALMDAINHAEWERGVDYEYIKDGERILRHNFTKYKSFMPTIPGAPPGWRSSDTSYPYIKES